MVVPEPTRDFAAYAQAFLGRNEAYRAAWQALRRQPLFRRKEQARPWGLAFSIRSRCPCERHARILAAGMPPRHAHSRGSACRRLQPVPCGAQRLSC